MAFATTLSRSHAFVVACLPRELDRAELERAFTAVLNRLFADIQHVDKFLANRLEVTLKDIVRADTLSRQRSRHT